MTHGISLETAGEATVGATVRNDNAGEPSADSAYLFPPVTITNTAVQAVTHTGEVLLEPNRKYWLLINSSSITNNQIQVQYKRSDDVTTGQPGWILATNSSYSGGGGWVTDDTPYAIRLQGIVQPQILISNYTGTYVGGTESRTLGSATSGTPFTTGDNQTGYLLTKVTHGMRLENAGSETARAWVAPDNNGEPGTAVYQFPDRTITDTTAQAVTHVGEVLLEPNKKYWILLQRDSPRATHIRIHYKRSDDVVTGLPDWILATTSSYPTLNGYVALNTSYALRLEGLILAPATDEPSDSDFPMDASTPGRLRIGTTSTGTLDAVDDNRSGDLLKIEGLTRRQLLPGAGLVRHVKGGFRHRSARRSHRPAILPLRHRASLIVAPQRQPARRRTGIVRIPSVRK